MKISSLDAISIKKESAKLIKVNTEIREGKQSSLQLRKSSLKQLLNLRILSMIASMKILEQIYFYQNYKIMMLSKASYLKVM